MPKPKGLRLNARLRTRGLRLWLRALVRFGIFNATVINRDVIPPKGTPAIIACNHIAMTDPVFLWGAMRRAAVAVAMAELWSWPFVGAIMRDLGHIPVDRKSRKSGARVIELSMAVLKRAGAILIFPEGKCSKDGTLLPFKRGVTDVAFATMSVVVPAGIQGSNVVLPLGSKKINRRARVHLAFGAPMDPRVYLNRFDDEATAKRHFNEDLWNAIKELSTKDYSKAAA